MSDSYAFKLSFVTDMDKETSFSIPFADSTLDETQVLDYMDQIVACNIVMTKEGKLAEPSGAIRTQTSIVELTV